ncbi:MAG: succinate dehydrogenase, hydrophobic membrane anchor protein [Alphaproteobacteria bacterium]|nr:succinate dehydrogenase, hydrophobic membrane anchor protein [Alphaproteobacteria bacterium]
MAFRTPMKTARGLGSAKDGTAHWWAQRLTALALIPLTIWFVASVAALTGADHAVFLQWISSPVVTVLLVLLIVATFHHAQSGIQVVIEDYVHSEPIKISAIIAVKGLAIVLGVASVVAVLRIALGAGI